MKRSVRAGLNQGNNHPPLSWKRCQVARKGEAVEKAGLPKGTRFHDLRHYYASTLIAASLNPKSIQRRLGHATVSETFDTYGHLFPEDEDLGRGAIDAEIAKDLAEQSRNKKQEGNMYPHPLIRGVEVTSRPVGRVLSFVAEGATIHLGPSLPAASSGLPARLGRAALERRARDAPESVPS